MPHFPKPYFRKARKLYYVQIDGRQINLGSDREEAYAAYHRLMAEPSRQRLTVMSCAVLADEFLDWVRNNRAADTYEWYRYRLQRFVDCYPRLSTEELRPYHVEKWADSYRLSVTSRRNYLRSVKRLMKWAKRQGYIDHNPIADMEVPAAQHREVAVTQAEFDSLLCYVRNAALLDLLVVTWETGCRPQESLRVEARHVDVTNHRWVFPKSESKMRRIARVVYLSDRAMEITRRLTLVHPDGPLFRNNRGRPWTTEAVNCCFFEIQMRMGKDEMKRREEEIPVQQIEQFVKSLSPTKTHHGIEKAKTAAELRCEAKRKLTFRRAAKLAPHYSLYAFRHSWATNALQKGLDAMTVAILMGHEDPSTLAKVYQHLSLNPQHLLQQAKRAAAG